MLSVPDVVVRELHHRYSRPSPTEVRHILGREARNEELARIRGIDLARAQTRRAIERLDDGMMALEGKERHKTNEELWSRIGQVHGVTKLDKR
jgi:hypothetical protein